MVTWCRYLKSWTISVFVFLHILKCHEKLTKNPPSDFAVIFFKVRLKFTLGWLSKMSGNNFGYYSTSKSQKPLLSF